jgi:hypothetical protein
MTWQPDDIPKDVQELYEQEAENLGLFPAPEYYCLTCGHRFKFNIDGCPECGGQNICNEAERDL